MADFCHQCTFELFGEELAIIPQRTEPGTFPFAASFQMSTFGPYGEIVYTITITESKVG